ncbi:MAG: SDR family oxidoreductase [Thalassovita sp.]
MTKYLITGAAGQLGQLVVAQLAQTVPADAIIALVRRDSDQAQFAELGVQTRLADYTDPVALNAALEGVDRLLLISSNALGQRTAQHKNVIDAAVAQDVGFIAYTSLLRADVSPMILAKEHLETETLLQSSGIQHSLLRNGWYSENLHMSLQTDLQMSQHFGAAGTGRFSTASRADYASAAAKVLSDPTHHGQTFELGGDSAYSLNDYANTLSTLTGQTIAYVDLPQAALLSALETAGLPPVIAEMLADSDRQAGNGWLETTSRDLSQLIGRPTEPYAQTLGTALARAEPIDA